MPSTKSSKCFSIVLLGTHQYLQVPSYNRRSNQFSVSKKTAFFLQALPVLQSVLSLLARHRRVTKHTRSAKQPRTDVHRGEQANANTGYFETRRKPPSPLLCSSGYFSGNSKAPAAIRYRVFHSTGPPATSPLL